MQSRQPFELLAIDRVRIGDIELRAHHNQNAPDGTDRYIVEATANRYQPHAQYFPPVELRHVKPSDLPNAFYISIESLAHGKLKFRDIHFLSLSKHADQLKLTLTIALDHADWHLPISLTNFAEAYADSLSSEIVTAELERVEYGVSIACSLIAPPNVDLYKTTSGLAEVCLRKYRECIASNFSLKAVAVKPASAVATVGDSSGPKWWMRYVVVPILGSGAAVAAITGLITILK